jgi:hypothetical protein
MTDSQKNYVIVGLAGILVVIVGSQWLKGASRSSREVDPSLIPMNVSNDPKKTEYSTPYEVNQVRNTIVKNTSVIQPCYLKHLEKKDAVTSGHLQLDWQISPSGEVISPQVVTSNLEDKDLEKCIVDKFKTLKFPPPPSDKPVYSSFNYVFHKEGESLAPQLVSTPQDSSKKIKKITPK